MAIDPQKIEDKLDRIAAGGTEIQMDFGGVKFQTMLEVMEFAKLMSLSQSAVPPHLRNNPGACLAICTKALRFRFDPFALAEHSFEMMKDVETTITNPNGGRSTQKEKVGIICYDSYVLRAIINAWAPIVGGIKYTFNGEGDERTCTASAKRLDTGEIVELKSVSLGKRKDDIGVSDKGYLKGSPLWITKPDQQQSYDAGRDLCRREFPEILMGWYDKDEFEETARAAIAKDVTPTSSLKDRLKGQKDRGGFHAENTAQLPAPTETPLPTAIPDPEPAKETVAVAEPEKAPAPARKQHKAAPEAPAEQAVVASEPTQEQPAEATEPVQDTSDWLDEQIAIANNLKSMDALNEQDPQVWRRLKADKREADLGKRWDTEGFEPNKARLSKKK